jgi:hypothetical protein
MLRDYLRLLPDDTSDLSPYINAAKSKARSAGVPDYQNNAQYDIFILALAAMQYDNRGLSLSGMSSGGTSQSANEENMRRMINGYVLELRNAGEDEFTDNESDDGGAS